MNVLGWLLGMGLQVLVPIGVVVYAILLFRQGGRIRVTGPVLVLRKFQVNERAPDKVLIRIVGRASGFIGWLLALLRWENETSLTVTGRQLTIERASLFGRISEVVPLRHISLSECGYAKPFFSLMIGLFFGLPGIFALLAGLQGVLGSKSGSDESVWIVVGGIAQLGIGGAFLLHYWLARTVFISIVVARETLSVVFKRSVIEGVELDMKRVEQASALLNRKILDPEGPQEASGVVSPPMASAAARCAACGAENNPAAKFCRQCGGTLGAAMAAAG